MTIITPPAALLPPAAPSPAERPQALVGERAEAASPGARFARAIAEAGSAIGVQTELTVSIPSYLPSAFPLFSTRPRYTVRQLVRTVAVADDTIYYVAEAPSASFCPSPAAHTYESTPEALARPILRAATLTELRVDVPVPAGLLAHPAVLRSFVDYRVLVRMGVRENQTLLYGSPDGAVPGLLRLPGVRSGPRVGMDELVEVAAAVEDTGGSCDGIVVHPRLYWELVRAGILGRLAEAGIRVSRTRMMPPGQALLGDFRAAVTFLDPGLSSLTLRRGADADGGDILVARARMGLAVPLPQHLMLVTVSGTRP